MNIECNELAMRVVEGYPCSIMSDNGDIVAPFIMQDYGKRIVACWNACAEIQTDEIRRIIADRDRLFALLKRVQSGEELSPEFCSEIDAMIEEVEGKS